MKKLFIFLILGLLITGCIKKRETVNIPNEKLILDLIQDYARAMRSEDIQLLDNYYAHENNLSFFPLGNFTSLSGWPEVKKYWEDFFRDYEITGFALDSVSVKVVGRTAWCKGTWEMRLSKGKKKQTWIGRFTTVFENREGKWEAVHEHNSSPRLITK